MNNNYLRIGAQAILVAGIGVFGVDYFSHLFFSDPMETVPYFLAKSTFYLIFSLLFLSFVTFTSRKSEFVKVVIGGIVIASIWGIYYNILPPLLHYYPFGISLYGLSFLGMGVVGTGVAFGTVHTLAFIVGYYAATRIIKS